MIKVKYIIILSFWFIISCKKDVDKIENDNNNHIDNLKTTKDIECSIDFPDTIFVNQAYEGIVDYKSVLDTITVKFGGKENNRHTLFIMKNSKFITDDYNELKLTVKDTFIAYNNRMIPFYDIKFNELGEQYIDGIVKDIVVIDLHKKDKDGNDLVRVIEKEERVFHKVVVVSRPIPKESKS